MFSSHIHKLSPSRSESRDDSARHFLRHIDDHFFKRLGLHPVLFLDNYLRLRNLELKSFSAHVFAKDGDVELTSAVDCIKFVLVEVDFQAYVDLKLSLKALTDLSSCYKLAIAAEIESRIREKKVTHPGIPGGNGEAEPMVEEA